DPFDEQATLALAEVMAVTGQKLHAVKLLETYCAEVGKSSRELKLPAELLNRRIMERFDSDIAYFPMVGRDEALAWLHSQFNRATSGEATVSFIWGDAGIGKTRLVQEYARHLLLHHAKVERFNCQSHDATRPLGAFTDLV